MDDIRRALDVAPPDAIFHLAGISSVPGASGDPGAAAEVNVVGVARLLAEVRVRRRVGVLDPAVLVVGSAEQYGRHEKARPAARRGGRAAAAHGVRGDQGGAGE